MFAVNQVHTVLESWHTGGTWHDGVRFMERGYKADLWEKNERTQMLPLALCKLGYEVTITP